MSRFVRRDDVMSRFMKRVDESILEWLTLVVVVVVVAVASTVAVDVSDEVLVKFRIEKGPLLQRGMTTEVLGEFSFRVFSVNVNRLLFPLSIVTICLAHEKRRLVVVGVAG